MAGIDATHWQYITGGAAYTYLPKYGCGDVVYRKSDEPAAASSKFTQQAYLVVLIGFRTNPSTAAPQAQHTSSKNNGVYDTAGADITVAVASQAGAPWVYDLVPIPGSKKGSPGNEGIQPASIIHATPESDLTDLAGIKTQVGSAVASWADPT